MSHTTLIIRALAAFILLGASLQGNAATVNVADLLQETAGPFQHNAFHRARGHHGMRGPILAWFDVGPTDTGFWNTDTGDFELSVRLYRDRSLSRPAGTARATGNLSIGGFNGHDGGLLGTLTWDFSHARNRYLKRLESATLSFLDVDYVTSTAGHNANSLVDNALTLWGAEGRYDTTTGLFNTRTTTIGMDMVAVFDRNVTTVPLPAAACLFGSGLAGLAAAGRRRPAKDSRPAR